MSHGIIRLSASADACNSAYIDRGRADELVRRRNVRKCMQVARRRSGCRARSRSEDSAADLSANSAESATAASSSSRHRSLREEPSYRSSGTPLPIRGAKLLLSAGRRPPGKPTWSAVFHVSPRAAHELKHRRRNTLDRFQLGVMRSDHFHSRRGLWPGRGSPAGRISPCRRSTCPSARRDQASIGC